MSQTSDQSKQSGVDDFIREVEKDFSFRRENFVEKDVDKNYSESSTNVLNKYFFCKTNKKNNYSQDKFGTSFQPNSKSLEVISSIESIFLRFSDRDSKVLSITRQGGNPGIYTLVESVPSNIKRIAIYKAYSVLGIVALTNDMKEVESFLILISGVELVGNLFGFPIYRIVETTFITFNSKNEYYYKQMPKVPSSTMKSFCESGLFYWSPDYDLTQSLQKQFLWDENKRRQHLYMNADRHFYWNRFLIRSFIHKRLTDFISVVIRGYVFVKEKEYIVENRSYCTISLISRISCMRAGTRYNARGVDDNGNVGNFVESEQIFISDNQINSFVEIRGSVPIFWEEPLLKTGYTPTLSRTLKASTPAFEKHFEHLINSYKQVHVINLLSKKKKEYIITSAYEKQFSYSKILDLKVRYTYYDFHSEYSQTYGNISKLINRSVARDLFREFGYFCFNYVEDEFISLQNGVFRVNCLDCLDRTNIVQLALARLVLSKQVRKIDGFKGIVDDPMKLGIMLNQMWADNGDALSNAYTGTGAIKSNYTRKGKVTIAGMIDDGVKSISRLYINMFKDSDNQMAVDLFLGKIEELVEQDEQPIGDIWVKEKMNENASKFTSYSEYKVFISTYNCNAKPPPLDNEKFNFDKFFDTVVCDHDSVDIYVFGFQEIVELSAQQTFWNANTTNSEAWENAILERLNNLRKKDGVILLRSIQLVGIHLLILVSKSSLINFKNLFTETVKVGWKGVAGNKGAACVSLNFFDTSICFICSHLTAGQKGYELRISDFHSITSDLGFGNSGNYKIPLNNHDIVFWFGDLNWRINMDYHNVSKKISERDWEGLLRFDQLKIAQNMEHAFVGYQEPNINWAPTYKYDAFSELYDTSDLRRTPAWTDRILYKSIDPDDVKPLMYDRTELVCSDHRPIRALFSVKIKTIDDNAYRSLKNEFFSQVSKLDDRIMEDEIKLLRETRDKKWKKNTATQATLPISIEETCQNDETSAFLYSKTSSSSPSIRYDYESSFMGQDLSAVGGGCINSCKNPDNYSRYVLNIYDHEVEYDNNNNNNNNLDNAIINDTNFLDIKLDRQDKGHIIDFPDLIDEDWGYNECEIESVPKQGLESNSQNFVGSGSDLLSPFTCQEFVVDNKNIFFESKESQLEKPELPKRLNQLAPELPIRSNRSGPTLPQRSYRLEPELPQRSYRLEPESEENLDQSKNASQP